MILSVRLKQKQSKDSFKLKREDRFRQIFFIFISFSSISADETKNLSIAEKGLSNQTDALHSTVERDTIPAVIYPKLKAKRKAEHQGNNGPERGHNKKKEME